MAQNKYSVQCLYLGIWYIVYVYCIYIIYNIHEQDQLDVKHSLKYFFLHHI